MLTNHIKTHCQVPGCHSGAMRGRTQYRYYRSTQLGPASLLESPASQPWNPEET